MKIKRPATQCGLYGNRAKVVARNGSALTYRWPCGYEKTQPLTIGPRGMKKPVGEEMAALFARYWSDGVTFECPRCRRKALALKRKATR